MKKIYQVQNLTCANCAAKFEREMQKSDHFADVSVNVMNQKIVTEQETDKCEREYLQKEIDKIEDGVIISCDEECKYCNVSNKNQNKINKEIKTIPLKLVLYILAAILIVFAVIFENNIIVVDRWLMISFFIDAYLLIAYDIIWNMLKAFKNKNFFDENTLMVVASFSAIILGIFGRDYFLEAIAVMVFYKVGEYFQDKAVEKSKKSISETMDLRPEIANLVIDGNIEVVDPKVIKIGDIILVKPGEKIAVDGIVVKGSSSLDTKALSGESLPRDVEVDSLVYSGAINLSNPIEVKAVKEFKDSTASKIIEFVENNNTKKAKTEKFITKFAKYYTPVVVIVALIFAFIVPIFTANILNLSYLSELMIYGERAIVFLVISCPCALVLSVPLTFFSGIGLSSKMGILFKSSSDLEALQKIDVFVFDKTGTLTKGEFKVSKFVNESNLSDNELIMLAAAAELDSNHPIAKSIVEYNKTKINRKLITNAREEFGKGVSIVYDTKNVILGNNKYFSDLKIDLKEADELGTIIYIAIDNLYAGYLVISDTIKESAKETVEALHALNKKVVMITGDNQTSAQKVAESLDIDEYYYNQMPLDKSNIIVRYQKSGLKVLFVGDGINDAPVLATADLGISMGDIGSDVAIESSDIVLMNGEPKAIISALSISKKTIGIAIQNIIFALVIKLVTMVLGAIGIAHMMWIAVFADVGVALLAVLNAVRILYLKKV